VWQAIEATRARRLADQRYASQVEAEKQARHGAEQESMARAEATWARHNAQQQLVDLCTTMGLMSEKRRDSDLALLWFARGIRLAEQGEPQRLNRIRAGNWLNHVARPIRAFTVRNFREQNERFVVFEIHPAGHHLLTVLDSERCFIWDLEEDKELPLPGGARLITAAAWSPNGDRLALGTPNGRVDIFSFPAGELEEAIEVTGPVRASTLV
jgi:hypothetical protein